MGVDVCREEPVRANEHVHRTRGKALERLPLLGGRHKAREHANVQVEGREAREERLEVLLGKDGRGAQHHDLLAVLAALERRAQGDLGLAEAHVAAEQPVHGLSRLHVGLDVGHGRSLVGRELVGEARLHVQLGRRVWREGIARHRRTAGVEVHQVKRELLGGAPGLARGARPVGRIEAREARGGAVGPHVARDAVDLLERNKELVAAGVLQQEVVAHAPGDLLAHDLREERDAVRGVDDVIAGPEREGHARGVHALGATPVASRARREVRDREHTQVGRGHHDAGRHRRVREGHRAAAQGLSRAVGVCGGHGDGILDRGSQRLRKGDVLVVQPQLERLSGTAVRRGKDHAGVVVHELAHDPYELVVRTRDVGLAHLELRRHRTAHAEDGREGEALLTPKVHLARAGV